jgi:hypothetical protein
VEIEHKGVTFNPDNTVKSGFEERTDDFSSVAYWYQAEPHKPWPAPPAGYARMYYDYSKIVEGEALIPKATASQGPVVKQDLGNSSGGAQLFWQAPSEGQTLSLPVEVGEAGKYELVLFFTTSFDYGTYQILLDDKPLGDPVDFYTANIEQTERYHPSQNLDAGTHTLTFKNVGKNGASKGYFFGFDGLLLNK